MTEEEYLSAARIGYKYGKFALNQVLEDSPALAPALLFVSCTTTSFTQQTLVTRLEFLSNKVTLI
jgi:hypothetical protein